MALCLYVIISESVVHQKWRHSIWSKLSAAGFISLVVLGNIWFILGMSHPQAPHWLQLTFVVNIFWLLVSGLGLGLHILLQSIRPKEDPERDHNVQE